MRPAWWLDTVYDGCCGGWAVRQGLTVKYGVRIGGYEATLAAAVVDGPFGLDVIPNAEDWEAEHRKLGMPVPPIPHATRERTWWDRVKDAFGGDQNAGVPRVGRWHSDIGDIISAIVPVITHRDGIPVVDVWIVADEKSFDDEEAKLVAEFEREQRKDDDDDDDEGGKRRRRGRRRREPISCATVEGRVLPKKVILDGKNIIAHGSNRKEGVMVCHVDYLNTLIRELETAHVSWFCFLDANTPMFVEEVGTEVDKRLYDELLAKYGDRIVRVNGGHEADDDILFKADRERCDVISCDNFQKPKYLERYPWLRVKDDQGRYLDGVSRRVHSFLIAEGEIVIQSLGIAARLTDNVSR